MAWRVGKRVEARQIKASKPVLDHLTAIAQQVDDLFDSETGGTYSPEGEQDDHKFLTVAREHVLDSQLEEQCALAGDLEVLDLEDLETRRIICYAYVAGTEPEDRRLYVKRFNPVQMLRKSLVTRFTGQLSVVEEPILGFDAWFDVVLDQSDVRALNQRHFEALFKESEAVLAKAPEWVEDLGQIIPVVVASQDQLSRLVQRNGVVRRRLLSVLTKGNVPTLTADQLRTAITDHGYDAAVMMPGDEVELTDANASVILEILNEDLWTGYFSQENWSAGRKRPR